VDYGDPAAAGSKFNAAANYTEFSPSRVLGKNLFTLGDFKLLRKLGEGAMGAVYKATQLSFQRSVALKILFPHVANNPKLVERLYRESKVMFELTHPNIVAAFGNYRIDDDAKNGMVYHCVAMEYISGHSTQKWLNHLGRFPVADALRIVIDCAKALEYAHARNVIHRDIKPDNILLSRAGAVKVADLGMAKTHDEDMSLTQTGHAVGTPWYMPLEQAKNAKDTDGRCDIYALGCTLYAFLTGSPPFMGKTVVDTIHAKDLGTFPPARQVNAEVPERLDLIIAKMAAKYPKNRYQTCTELIKVLESLALAGDSVSFVAQRREAPAPKTAESPAARDETPPPAPTQDPNVWFVQVTLPGGEIVTRQYLTAQLQKMLEEGTIGPTAQASRSPDGGFRTLATYREFQSVAMGKMSKKAADKTTAKYRGLYKKIEEADRAAAEKERDANQEDTPFQANVRYWTSLAWKALPIPLGIGLFILVLWLITLFTR
jgi:serine/threonine-protein kinase